MAETAGIQDDHPMLVVFRDNAGENTSKGLYYYFIEHGVKNDYALLKSNGRTARLRPPSIQ
jgi:hypothetical protein